VLIAVSILAALAGTLGWTYHRRQVDLEVYLMGARHLRDPQLYHLTLSGVQLPFTYPPFSTLFFWPLGIMSTPVASVVWALVNLVALAVIIAVALLIVRPDERGGSARIPWALVLMLLGPAVLLEPVMLDLSFGQVNLVLVALAFVDMTTHVSLAGRTLPRGIGVGVAAAIKLVPLIFVAFLLVTRQFRAALTAVVTFAACAAVAFVVNASASASFWKEYVNDQARIGRVSYVSNQSVQGAVDRITHHLWNPRAMETLEGLIVVLGVLVAWWAYRSSSVFLAFLVVGVTGLLASPITWAHHMVYVVPVLMWLWWGRDRPAGGRAWALIGAALFYVAPMWLIPHGPRFDMREHGAQLWAGSSFTLASVIFIVGVTAMLAHRGRPHRPRLAAS
jgi:alpha-1,2-mannosyltransferase